jgi:ankyrin repeat protein
MTALHYAATQGITETCRLLLDHGAHLNLPNQVRAWLLTSLLVIAKLSSIFAKR